jgi:CBS-domain-containing membrane protein
MTARRPGDGAPVTSENVVVGLLRRLRFAHLTAHASERWVVALFSFVNGCLAIGIMALLAHLTSQPLIFPSLGPTAFLFFYTPLAPAASPRNTIIGHAIGTLAGYGSLLLFGLQDAGPALSVGVTWSRVAAAALSLGLTSALMIMLRAPHPPAGATTLIISLGILHEVDQLVVLMIAVCLLTMQALAINRLAGLPYPLWAAPPDAAGAASAATRQS